MSQFAFLQREWPAVFDAATRAEAANDLQLGLAAGTYIHGYDSARPADKYLTEAGEAVLAQIEKGYQSV